MKEQLIKLTDHNGCTKYNTQWGSGVTVTIPQERRRAKLYSDGVLCACRSLNLALLMKPDWCCLAYERAFEAKGEVVVEGATKVGCYELTTIKEIPLPDWYLDGNKRQQVQLSFVILTAKAVLPLYSGKDDAPAVAIEVAERVLMDILTEGADNIPHRIRIDAFNASAAAITVAYAANIDAIAARVANIAAVAAGVAAVASAAADISYTVAVAVTDIVSAICPAGLGSRLLEIADEAVKTVTAPTAKAGQTSRSCRTRHTGGSNYQGSKKWAT